MQIPASSRSTSGRTSASSRIRALNPLLWLAAVLWLASATSAGPVPSVPGALTQETQRIAQGETAQGEIAQGEIAQGEIAQGEGEGHDAGRAAGALGGHAAGMAAGQAGGGQAGEGHARAGQGEDPHAEAVHGTEGHELDSAKGIFMHLFHHLLPHEFEGMAIDFGRVSIPLYNTQLWQVIAIALILLVFLYVLRSLRGFLDHDRRPNWLGRVFAGFVLFIRDEMVLPLLGEEKGRLLLPYFLFVFFFIAFMNLLGLVPGGVTATASIFVTGAMAVTTLGMMIGGGMLEQGPLQFWKNLVPHGMPAWLTPLMFVVELIGLLVKPFALMIRLFANMTGGHLVVYSFLGLIFVFSMVMKLGSASYAVAVPSVGLAVFIMIIESFVALLQAYIFTYLSILFVGMCLHPEH